MAARRRFLLTIDPTPRSFLGTGLGGTVGAPDGCRRVQSPGELLNGGDGLMQLGTIRDRLGDILGRGTAIGNAPDRKRVDCVQEVAALEIVRGREIGQLVDVVRLAKCHSGGHQRALHQFLRRLLTVYAAAPSAGGFSDRQARGTRTSSRAMTSQPAASRRRSDSSSPVIDDLAFSCRHVGQGAGDPALAPEDRSPAGNYI